MFGLESDLRHRCSHEVKCGGEEKIGKSWGSVQGLKHVYAIDEIVGNTRLAGGLRPAGMILDCSHAPCLMSPHVPTRAKSCFTGGLSSRCTGTPLRESIEVGVPVLEFRPMMSADLITFNMFCHHSRTIFMPSEDHAE
jgi:hypothetical protein